MASVKIAAGALLSTVTDTANTVSSLITSVAVGADMINDFATAARDAQRKVIKANAVGRKDILMADRTIEIDKSRSALDDYIGTDQVRADRCKAIWAQLEEALA